MRIRCVAAVSIVAVGLSWGLGPAGATSATLVLCSAGWRVVPTPALGHHNASFASISLTPQGTAWAVGTASSGSDEQGVVEAWDGAAWTVVASPEPGAFSQLAAVHAFSEVDVWVAGLFQDGPIRPLLEHWDGSRWHLIPMPASAATGVLTGIDGASAQDVWFVGSHILHWDGHVLRNVHFPGPGRWYPDFQAVHVTAADDVWAVGDRLTGPIENRPRPLIEHWNGAAWKAIPTPDGADHAEGTVSALDATGPGDAWAVGTINLSRLRSKNRVEHWDGQRWSVVGAPAPPRMDFNAMHGVVETAPSHLLVTGGAATAFSGEGYSFLWSFDGATWTSTIRFPVGDHSVSLVGIANEPTSHQEWVVGSEFHSHPLSASVRPLALEYFVC